MEIFNQEFIQEIIRLTWRNPAFMAIAIALVWLIPQLFIRNIMAKKYEKRKSYSIPDTIFKGYD